MPKNSLEESTINMSPFKKLTQFNISLDKEIVFHLIDCYPNSPIYSDVLEEYQELEQIVLPLITPVAYLKFACITKEVSLLSEETLPVGTEGIYCIASIGKEVSALSSRYFDDGDYLRGMLTNAVADAYLYQMDTALMEHIKELSSTHHFDIAKKFESPTHLPMRFQKEILETFKKEELMDITVTNGFMFSPVKTTGFFLETRNSNEFHYNSHLCDTCNSKDCRLRKYTSPRITVIGRGKPVIFPYDSKMNLLDNLIHNDIYMSADCGGKGRCKKCKIKVIEGNLEITKDDSIVFSKEELNEGYRLSCKAFAKENCTILLLTGNESDFEVITTTEETTSKIPKIVSPNPIEHYGIGIDIGTTTIAISLFHLMEDTNNDDGNYTNNFEIIETYTTVNKQRMFGTDVISRMQASNEGKKEDLQKCIQTVLLDGIHCLLSSKKEYISNIRGITIAGNTTMIHLLLGYSCKTLGIYPFTPVNLSTLELSFFEVFQTTDFAFPVTILPGISAFVGGDIVSGLYALDFEYKNDISLFVDLGTNGEMAIGNKERILVTSTAAGPAFEGGNISCGVGGIAGAIHTIHIVEDKLQLQTIGNKTPIGICGTGVVELIAELLDHDIIDDTGLLTESFFSNGYEVAKDKDGSPICFTQKDVREMQLAKAAICAGIETLMHHLNVNYSDISTLYLAGGFGYKINIEKAVKIGLLPQELLHNVKTVGNSSLLGCIKYQCDINSKEVTEYIKKHATEINLSADPFFNEKYVDHMMF